MADDKELKGLPLLTQITIAAAKQQIFVSQGKKAWDWFRERAQETKVAPQRLIKQKTLIAPPPKVGQLYFYQYEAKWAKKLPYWDKYPVMFMAESYDNGWLGINLHYLPLQYRAALMDALMTAAKTTKKRGDYLKISYEILKGAKKYAPFVPCIKRYLTSQLRSGLFEIPREEWNTALWLPLARWQKRRQVTVWRDSEKAIHKSMARFGRKGKSKK